MRRPTRHFEYVDDGAAIYVDSFATIRRESDLSSVPADAEKVAVRMIHGTGQAVAQDAAPTPAYAAGVTADILGRIEPPAAPGRLGNSFRLD